MPSKKQPYVSIVVPALNAENTIKKCIESLIRQNYSKNLYEIIIVDNGSTDKTSNILGKFPKDITVLIEPVKGSYRARNTGILHAKGDIILFTDSDCVAGKNWITSMVSSFKSDKVKIVGGSVKALAKDNFLQKYCDIFCHSQEYYFKIRKFAASNMGIRKKLFVKSGLFKESLFSGGDFELCSRLIKNDIEIAYNPTALVYTKYSSSFWVFFKKSFFYGKGISIIRKKTKKGFYVKKINYPCIIFRYGPIFAFFKILQDLSFYSGLIFGRLASK